MKNLNNDYIKKLDMIKMYLNSCRELYMNANKVEDQIFDILADLNIDVYHGLDGSEYKTTASNIKELMTCYTNYGECDVDDIISILRKIY